MSDVVVYAHAERAPALREQLAAACQATGISVSLELFGSGSLFQRLRTRRSPPPADVVVWWGPYAAQAAALAELMQPYQPANLPPQARHDAGWRWIAVDFQPFYVTGEPKVSTAPEVGAVPRLAMADPERSEVGLAVALAMLDAVRQTSGDVEQGWSWWQLRSVAGLMLGEDDAGALNWVREGRASHALTLQEGGARLMGLAPLPHALGLAANARNVDAAQQLLDWLAGPEAPSVGGLSAWQVESNGLAAFLDGAPRLDVDWLASQYNAVRRRWAAAGFGPTLGTR